jgi:lipopolysaccharide/colanic/teichoic acid biosynthesis glycosyltransferase
MVTVDEMVARRSLVSESAYARWVKPAFDRVCAVALLVVLAPVFGLISLAILVTMGGPVIFRQQRVGLGGQDFTILKFRTMRPDKREAAQPISFADRRRTHKSNDDPRHTRLGRFLRASSLDELPQLVNVLRGEMSLVGPRPELSEVADLHGFRWHPRHGVRPGITGLWQVSPERSELLHENIDIDFDYIEDVTARTDLRILLATVGDVMGRTGK